MTERREDPRIPLTSGSIIKISHKLNELETETISYYVEECIASGGQALLYKCKNSVGHPYCIKEYYPFDAIRNEESDDKEIIPFCGWDDIRNGLQISQKLARSFAPTSHQAFFLPIDADDERMVEVMPYATNDCYTLGECVARWDSECNVSSETRIKKAVQIIDSFLTVLVKLHEFTGENNEFQGLVHRDINPDNILWAENDDQTGVAFPIDFSCCSEKDGNNSDCKSFSPGYSHPYLTDASIQVDLYGAAAVLVFLTKGSEIYDMYEALNLPDLTNEWIIWEIIETLDIPKGVKRKLGKTIQKATTLDENEQYSSAYEMREDIKMLLEIIDRKGMHPEVLFDASKEEFKKQCRDQGVFCYEFDRDLLTVAVDSESKEPVDLLKQNTILTGAGGAGKTTCIRDSWEKCLEAWKKDPKNNPVPVFVSLNTFKDYKSNWDYFIRDYILEKYFPNISVYIKDPRKALMGMLGSMGRYVFFLDGINEAVGSDKLKEEITKFAAIENVTVVVTSRNDLGDGWGETKKWFSTAELMPLNDDLIIKKLQKKELTPPSKRLLETLRRPMFLAMYLRLRITNEQVKTPGQILYEHHNYLIEVFKKVFHSDELVLLKLVLQQILPKIASSINSMMCDSEQIYGVVRNIHFKSVKFRDIADSLGTNKLTKEATSILQNCGILRKVNEDAEGVEFFAFFHEVYLEFYQALEVYSQMEAYAKGKQLPEVLSAGVLPDTVMYFLGDLWGEHDFEIKKSCADKASPIENWMQVNLSGKRGEAVQIAVKNLIETMKQSRNGYITANYSNLDLSLTYFDDCDISNSIFHNAILRDSTLCRVGHYNDVCCLCFVPGHTWIISGAEKEHHVYVWDYSNGSLVYEITCEGFVQKIDIAVDGSKLAVQEHSKDDLFVEVFNLEDGLRINKYELGVLDSPSYFKHPPHIVRIGSDNASLICCGDFGEENKVYIWDIKKGLINTPRMSFDPRKAFNCEEYKATQFVLSEDRKELFCTSSIGELGVWNIETGTIAKKGVYKFDFPFGLIGIYNKNNLIIEYIDFTTFAFDLSSKKLNELSEVEDCPVITAGGVAWGDSQSVKVLDLSHKIIKELPIPNAENICAAPAAELLAFSTQGEIHIAYKARLVCSFRCGDSTNHVHTFFHFSQPKIFCWNEHGIVRRITKKVSAIERRGEQQLRIYSEICCLNNGIGRIVVPYGNSEANYFDGRYIITVEGINNCAQELVVRDIGTSGTDNRILSAPWDPFCEVYDSFGKILYSGESHIQWIKYFPEPRKLVVAQQTGRIRAWDEKEHKWMSIGCWEKEISHRSFERAWSNIMGNYIITDTHDGHVVFWDHEGSCIADFPVHSSALFHVDKIRDTDFFVSDDWSHVRCVWNWRIPELVGVGIKTEHSFFRSREPIILGTIDNFSELYYLYSNSLTCESDSELMIYCERIGGTTLIGCIPNKRDLFYVARNINSDLIALYDHIDSIFIYYARSLKLYRKIILDEKRSGLCRATDFCFSPNGEKLAVMFEDGNITFYDLPTLKPTYWRTTNALNVAGSNFKGANISTNLRSILQKNGAIVD